VEPIRHLRDSIAAAVAGTAWPEVRIGDLLNRRGDLSTFLVHLTKGDDPKAALLSILNDQRIKAVSPMGWAKMEATSLGPDAEKTQKVACFSETPLDQIHTMCADIARRQVKLKPFGLAFTKMVARRNGANPVWYFNLTAGYYSPIATALSALRTEACADEATFVAHPGSSIFPYFEWMGTGSGGAQHEFWWEREWRRVGDFYFADEQIALVLAPEEHHREFDARIPGKCIDPRWSLERMIAKLVGLRRSDVTPFASR
jgi:hypothetical protein